MNNQECRIFWRCVNSKQNEVTLHWEDAALEENKSRVRHHLFASFLEASHFIDKLLLAGHCTYPIGSKTLPVFRQWTTGISLGCFGHYRTIIHNQRIMRIDYAKPTKASLQIARPQDNERQDPFAVNPNDFEDIEIEIDLDFQTEHEASLDYLDAQLTVEEEMLLDFLLPDRPKSTVRAPLANLTPSSSLPPSDNTSTSRCETCNATSGQPTPSDLIYWPLISYFICKSCLEGQTCLLPSGLFLYLAASSTHYKCFSSQKIIILIPMRFKIPSPQLPTNDSQVQAPPSIAEDFVTSHVLNDQASSFRTFIENMRHLFNHEEDDGLVLLLTMDEQSGNLTMGIARQKRPRQETQERGCEAQLQRYLEEQQPKQDAVIKEYAVRLGVARRRKAYYKQAVEMYHRHSLARMLEKTVMSMVAPPEVEVETKVRSLSQDTNCSGQAVVGQGGQQGLPFCMLQD